ncbi:MAG: hypothetical protein M3245_04390 [Actinomycetota bacterium]|nr:hypothetical protein [Actinomycetota bacterium]
MRSVHLVVGWTIVAGFAVVAVWGLGAWVIRRHPGRAFWWSVAVVQVGLLVQLLAGIVLLAAGGRRPVLHYVYGVVFPVAVLLVAHWLGREVYADRPWVPFGVAAFFGFGLTLRAIMTGFGVG